MEEGVGRDDGGRVMMMMAEGVWVTRWEETMGCLVFSGWVASLSCLCDWVLVPVRDVGRMWGVREVGGG